MTELIIINSVIPFIWLYGENKNNILLKERSIRMLEEFPPENNSITRRWSKNKIKAKNTAESQALIQLTTNYCNKKRCLECQIGHLILNKE